MNLSMPLSPRAVLQQVAQALPIACRQDVIIIGSLAAGYYFFADGGHEAIRTKDVDCMFSPHAKVVAAAVSVTEELLGLAWTQRQGDAWSAPGHEACPTEELPLVRLKPPGGSDWFLELLGAPDAWQPNAPPRQFHRMVTTAGHFAVCSFGFLALVEHEPVMTELGVRVARPEMMALANLLHHPAIGPERMSGTSWKRSNKDLGRVLALAYLALARDRRNGTDEFDGWAAQMWAALQSRFTEHAPLLAQQAGQGLHALLDSPADLAQALEIAHLGLLASVSVDQRAFVATGRRLLADVIEPLEALAAPG